MVQASNSQAADTCCVTDDEKRERKREADRVYRETHAEQIKARRDARRETKREADRAYRQANLDRLRESDRQRYTANPGPWRERARRWREANPDRAREIQRAHYDANAEKIKERARLWAEDNPERLRETRRLWDEANPGKKAERDRLYYEANAERIKEKTRQWNQANPDKRAESNRRAAQRRRARLAGVPSEEWSTAEILERDGFECQIDPCLCPDGRAINPAARYFTAWSGTADHIQPISKGGPDLKTNLQAAHRACNSGKCDRWDEAAS